MVAKIAKLVSKLPNWKPSEGSTHVEVYEDGELRFSVLFHDIVPGGVLSVRSHWRQRNAWANHRDHYFRRDKTIWRWEQHPILSEGTPWTEPSTLAKQAIKAASRLHLPVGETPPGPGWKIETGNTEFNKWVRNA